MVGILLYPELIKDLFDFDINKSSYQVDLNLKRMHVYQILAYYRASIIILLKNPELADVELIKNKLREFILLMTKTTNAPSDLDFLAAMFKPNFAKFNQIINSDLYTNLSVDQLANLGHMSASSFKRKFKEVYNDSPLKYLN